MKVLSLGEIMLRLSSPLGLRLSDSEQLQVCYGVNSAKVLFSTHNNERLGTYYLETGTGPRSTIVVYDRDNSSFSRTTSLPWKMDDLFENIDIFHISGITPALSLFWREQTFKLVEFAHQMGCKVCLDLNYRSKLWNQSTASKTFNKLLPYVDYCSAGILDGMYLLDIVEPSEEIEMAEFYQRLNRKFPNLKAIFGTDRKVVSTSHNILQGFLYTNHKTYKSASKEISPIVDRVGGGDAYLAGILHGFIKGWNEQIIVDFATANTILKHTVKGDANLFTEKEVFNYLDQVDSKISR